MPDRTVAMGERKASLYQLPIDLIEEAELDRIGGVAPDGKVAATFCEGGAESPGVGGMHRGSLPWRIGEKGRIH